MTPGDTPSPPPGPPERDRSVRLAPRVFVHEDNLRYTAARSSGPGGQNVNRRATKVELRVNLQDLHLKPDAERRLKRLANHLITDAGELIITHQDARTQPQNKRRCLEHLKDLVKRALVKPKPRIPTKPTKGSRQRRLDAKKQRGQLKQQRQSAKRPPHHD